MVNHENIHKEQIKDFGLPFCWCKPLQILFGGILFYIIYFLEWLMHLMLHPSRAYSSISFEKEAYRNQKDLDYIPNKRKHFNQ